MYRLSENIPTSCCDLNTLSSAPTRYFWTAPSISEVEMDHVGKQFQKFTSLVLSSADNTTVTFSSFRPDLQIVRNYRNVCTHSSFLVEPRSRDCLQVAYPTLLLFLLRRNVPAEREHPYEML